MNDELTNDVLPEDSEINAIESKEQPTPEDALQKQMEEYKLGWQRALADYQNLQKETAARRAELVSLSEQQIVEEFIPVYDNFKKAYSFHPEVDASEEGKKIQNWITGISFIMKQFGDVLKSYKVEEIKTVGEKLDTRVHEAAGEEEVEGKEPGTIVREIDGGYTMGGRVIKPAKVIIAK
jgi:molecular chaperone GrpE